MYFIEQTRPLVELAPETSFHNDYCVQEKKLKRKDYESERNEIK